MTRHPRVLWLLSEPQEGTAVYTLHWNVLRGRFSANGMQGWCHYIWFYFPLVVDQQRFQPLSTNSSSLSWYLNSGPELGGAA